MGRSMMSFSTLPTSFWGSVLETIEYLFNLVHSKWIHLAPIKMWTRCKCLHHVRIWGYPTHVLNLKVDKLESRLEVCLFVRYPKGTKGYYFYSQVSQKVFVNTNVTFLNEDYMINNKSRNDIDQRFLEDSLTISQNIMDPILLLFIIPNSFQYMSVLSQWKCSFTTKLFFVFRRVLYDNSSKT